MSPSLFSFVFLFLFSLCFALSLASSDDELSLLSLDSFADVDPKDYFSLLDFADGTGTGGFSSSGAFSSSTGGADSSSSSSAPQVQCQPGEYLVSSSCFNCPQDTFSTSINSLSCTACANGTYAAPGSSGCSSLPSPPSVVSCSSSVSSQGAVLNCTVQPASQDSGAAFPWLVYSIGSSQQLLAISSSKPIVLVFSGLSYWTAYNLSLASSWTNSTSGLIWTQSQQVTASPTLPAPVLSFLQLPGQGALVASWSFSAPYVVSAPVYNVSVKVTKSLALVSSNESLQKNSSLSIVDWALNSDYTVTVAACVQQLGIQKCSSGTSASVKTPGSPALPPTNFTISASKAAYVISFLQNSKYENDDALQYSYSISTAGKTVLSGSAKGVSSGNQVSFPGYSYSTNYTLVVYTSNSVSVATSVSYSFQTTAAPAKILSARANLENVNFGVGSNLTVVFDKPINPISNVSFLSAVSSLSFSSSLSVDGKTAVFTVTSASASTSQAPAIGSTIVFPSVSTVGSLFVSSLVSPALTGSWSKSAYGIFSTNSAAVSNSAIMGNAIVSFMNNLFVQIPSSAPSSALYVNVSVPSSQGTFVPSGLSEQYLVSSTSSSFSFLIPTKSVSVLTAGTFFNLSNFVCSSSFAGTASVSLSLSAAAAPAVSVSSILYALTCQSVNHQPSVSSSKSSFQTAPFSVLNTQGISLAGISLSDPIDEANFPNAIVSVSLTTSSSAFFALPATVAAGSAAVVPVGFGSVNLLSFSSLALVLEGTISDLNGYLPSVNISLASSFISSAPFYVTINDLGNGGPGALSASASFNLNGNCALAASSIPSVSSVVFSDDYLSLLFTLNAPFFLSSTNVSALFVNPAVFGSSPSLQVSSTSLFKVILGNGASVLPAQSLTFASQAIGGCAATKEINSATISLPSIQSPSSPSSPSISALVGPSTVSSCDSNSFTAISANLAGRAATYNWFVNSVQVAATSTASYSPSFTAFAGQDVQLSVVVTSAFGTSSAPFSLSVTVSANPLPVLIPQSSLSVSISSSAVSPLTVLRASAAFSSCYSGAKNLSFVWSVSPVISSFQSVSSPALSVNASLQEINVPYVYTVVASLPGISGTSSLSFSVVLTSPAFAISASSALYQVASSSSTTAVAFSTALSYSGYAAGTSYLWSCVDITNSACVDANGAVLSFAATPSISVAPSVFPTGLYTISVSAWNGVNSQSISFTIQIVAEVVPIVSLVSSASSSVIVPSSTVAFQGSVSYSSVYTSAWSVVSTGSVSTALSTAVASAKTASLTLNIAGQSNFFSAGETYTFTLTVSSASNSAVSVSIPFSFTVASPPSAGTITSSQLTGTALSSLFSLSAPSWSSSFDLSYLFYYVDPSTGITVYLGESSSSSVVSSTFPQGDSTNADALQVGVIVTDIYGGSASATATITVSAAANQQEALSSFLSGSIASAAGAQDLSNLAHQLSVAGSSLLSLASQSGSSQDFIASTQASLFNSLYTVSSSSSSAPSSIASTLSSISSSGSQGVSHDQFNKITLQTLSSPLAIVYSDIISLLSSVSNVFKSSSQHTGASSSLSVGIPTTSFSFSSSSNLADLLTALQPIVNFGTTNYASVPGGSFAQDSAAFDVFVSYTSSSSLPVSSGSPATDTFVVVQEALVAAQSQQIVDGTNYVIPQVVSFPQDTAASWVSLSNDEQIVSEAVSLSLIVNQEISRSDINTYVQFLSVSSLNSSDVSYECRVLNQTTGEWLSYPSASSFTSSTTFFYCAAPVDAIYSLIAVPSNGPIAASTPGVFSAYQSSNNHKAGYYFWSSVSLLVWLIFIPLMAFYRAERIVSQKDKKMFAVGAEVPSEIALKIENHQNKEALAADEEEEVVYHYADSSAAAAAALAAKKKEEEANNSSFTYITNNGSGQASPSLRPRTEQEVELTFAPKKASSPVSPASTTTAAAVAPLASPQPQQQEIVENEKEESSASVDHVSTDFLEEPQAADNFSYALDFQSLHALKSNVEGEQASDNGDALDFQVHQ